MAKVSKSFLTKAETRVLLKALRAEGIKPPKPGWKVDAFGGTVTNHGSHSAAGGRKLGFDRTGWQVNNIDEDAVIAAVEGDR